MRFSLRTFLFVSCVGVPLVYGLWSLSDSLYGPFNGPVFWLSVLTSDFTDATVVPR